MRAAIMVLGMALASGGCLHAGGSAGLLRLRAAQAPSPSGQCTHGMAAGIVAVVRVADPGAVRGAAWLVVRGRGYADSASLYVRIDETGDQVLFAEAAHERRGTFEVTVRVPGHHAWRRSGIRVRQGVCHVEGVTLEVRPRRR